MGGQLDILQKNLSSLSSQAQQLSFKGLQSGNFGGLLTKAREQGGQFQQARVFLDQFFNTPEGRRFEGGSFDPATGQRTFGLIDIQRRAKELGFSSVKEFQELQGFAGRPDAVRKLRQAPPKKQPAFDFTKGTQVGTGFDFKTGRIIQQPQQGFVQAGLDLAKQAPPRGGVFLKPSERPQVKQPFSLSKTILPGIPVSIGTGKVIVPISDITEGIFKELEKQGLSKRKISELTTLSDADIDKIPFLSQSNKNRLKKLADLQEELVIGGLKGVEEEPEKIILTAFGATALTTALPALANIKLLDKVPSSVKRKGAKAITRFLTGLYLTSVGLRVAEEPTTELKAQKLGEIITTEVAPFSLGTRLGVKGGLRKDLKLELQKELDKLPANKRAAFEDYIKQTEVFGRFEPKANNIKLNNIESIPDPKAQKVIRSFLKNSKGNVIVGGSVAQTGQIKVVRKLGDMDLYLETGTPTQSARNLAKLLRDGGIKRVSNIRGEVTINGKKAIEFHDISRLNANIEQVIPNYKSPDSYIIKTPEGIRIQRIGLQAKRKLVAAFADPKRLATGKYRKDLKDFKTIADAIFRRAEINARNAFFFREKRIKALERRFGKKVSRKPFDIKEPSIKPNKLDAASKLKKIKKRTILKDSPKNLLTRKPPIIKRAESKASQKPFSQAKVKRVPPSQPFAKPSQKPRKLGVPSKPSQPPRKPDEFIKIPPPPIFEKEDPSQPPRKPDEFIKIPPPVFRRDLPSQKPFKPRIKLPPPPVFGRRKRKKPLKPSKKRKIELGEGYNVFVKKGSLKGLRVKRPTTRGKPKFLKANIKPLTKRQARSLGAFVSDRTISQTFKIKKTIKPAEKPLVKFPKRYYENTRGKWRGRIVKGVQQPPKNKFIERRKFAIDSRGEKEGLKVAKQISNLKKNRRKVIKLKSTKPIRRRRK